MNDQEINSQKNYKDINQNDFAKEVIEASKNNLIIVDFWAPWCGPCKDLGPRIEKIVSENKDDLKLIKINIDDNQELAGQLQIQSIPTVFAFKDGKIANAFQGSLSEKDITKFIEQVLGKKLDGDQVKIINEARELFNKGLYEESNNLIEEIIDSKKMSGEILELLIKNNVSLDKLDEANEIISSLDDEMIKNSFVKSAINAYKLAKNVGGESYEELINLLKKDSLSIETNKKLSDYYFNNKNYDEAFELILNLFSKIKKDERDKVKKILISYFDVLGHTHEKTKNARRRLSSMIFS